MRRSTFCAAAIALLCTHTAYAKNTAILTQTGDAQTLSVYQVGGNNGSATIDQSGNHNSIYAMQDDDEIGIGRVSPANILKIKQAGDHNGINATIFDLIQLDQKNTAPGLGANTMNIQQAGKSNQIDYGQQGYDNYADIKQGVAVSRAVASGNQAALSQLQSHNTATITQDGVSNRTVNRQTASSTVLNIKQNGTSNLSDVQQLHDDIAMVDQSGFGNTLKISQFDSIDDATVSQAGHDNDLNLIQDQPLDTASLTQAGSFNVLSVKQMSVGANATITQTGTASTITLSQ